MRELKAAIITAKPVTRGSFPGTENWGSTRRSFTPAAQEVVALAGTLAQRAHPNGTHSGKTTQIKGRLYPQT